MACNTRPVASYPAAFRKAGQGTTTRCGQWSNVHPGSGGEAARRQPQRGRERGWQLASLLLHMLLCLPLCTLPLVPNHACPSARRRPMRSHFIASLRKVYKATCAADRSGGEQYRYRGGKGSTMGCCKGRRTSACRQGLPTKGCNVRLRRCPRLPSFAVADLHGILWRDLEALQPCERHGRLRGAGVGPWGSRFRSQLHLATKKAAGLQGSAKLPDEGIPSQLCRHLY